MAGAEAKGPVAATESSTAGAEGRPPLAGVRGLLDAVLPRGAIVLATLTLGGYVMGLVRDRIFARTFGAGADLDAAGLKRPTATWTYVVRDNPFGSPLDRALGRLARRIYHRD